MRHIKAILLGLLVSGGMLIPGNIPNIIAAGKLNITSLRMGTFWCSRRFDCNGCLFHRYCYDSLNQLHINRMATAKTGCHAVCFLVI